MGRRMMEDGKWKMEEQGSAECGMRREELEKRKYRVYRLKLKRFFREVGD